MDMDNDRRHQNEEEKKESSSQNRESNYIERSKKVGRIGPAVTKLDAKTGYGTVHFHDKKDQLDVEATSGFASIRSNTGVFNGRYYYEVTLRTSGLMQIGWCTLQTTFNSQRGVGDDQTSYSFDGYRVKKWNKDSLAFGEAWSVGDIIGTLIDFDRRTITFWRNYKSLGKAFTDFKIGPNMVYFPAISFQRG